MNKRNNIQLILRLFGISRWPWMSLRHGHSTRSVTEMWRELPSLEIIYEPVCSLNSPAFKSQQTVYYIIQ